MADVDVGNLMTRVPEEEYISPPIDLDGSGKEEVALSWVANLPRGTSLEVFVRAAASGDLLDGESWGGSIKNGVAIESLSRHRYMQFRVRFLSLTGAAQPQLRGIKLLTR